jgi:hypothetical protein
MKAVFAKKEKTQQYSSIQNLFSLSSFIPLLGSICSLPGKPLFPRDAENGPILTAKQKN